MQTVGHMFRHILSTILILAILATGLPIFSPEDANRNNGVDIEDVILCVQDFAHTVDNPSAFAINLENAVSALQVMAGLKTIISSANNTKSLSASPILDLPYLISSFDFSFVPAACSKTAVQSFHYHSTLSSPDSPPPQNISVC